METLIKQKSVKISHLTTILAILILMVLSSFTFGQKSKNRECSDKKKTSERDKKGNWRAKPTKVRIPCTPRSKTRVIVDGRNKNDFTFSTRSSRKKDVAEKSIVVHSKVYVSFCVLRGSVKVNGWKRNEARIFIKGRKSNKVGFKVREKSRKDGKPLWIQVLGYDPKKEVGTSYNACLSGDIELDLPVNASVKIKNTKGESQTKIDSVRVANVEVLGGEIYLSNISQRINAKTFQGGVTVRNSSGKMYLSTINGNIIAHNTYSNEIGDYLKAKTRSGAITLQSVDQKEVESSSNTGSINYIGDIRSYGRYEFYTNKGSINLAIPANSSCQIVAAYGGSFQSELPIQDLIRERTGSLVFLRGKIGKGEANLNLKSFSGTIRIRERKESVLANF